MMICVFVVAKIEVNLLDCGVVIFAIRGGSFAVDAFAQGENRLQRFVIFLAEYQIIDVYITEHSVIPNNNATLRYRNRHFVRRQKAGRLLTPKRLLSKLCIYGAYLFCFAAKITVSIVIFKKNVYYSCMNERKNFTLWR